MEKKVNSFKELRIWKKGVEIVKDVYSLTKSFPKEESYGLKSQIRRAVISIPSNIAEGFKRFHNKEYKQFLYIALGSSAELETQLIISEELNFIGRKTASDVYEKIDHLSRMIGSLLKKLD